MQSNHFFLLYSLYKMRQQYCSSCFHRALLLKCVRSIGGHVSGFILVRIKLWTKLLPLFMFHGCECVYVYLITYLPVFSPRLFALLLAQFSIQFILIGSHYSIIIRQHTILIIQTDKDKEGTKHWNKRSGNSNFHLFSFLECRTKTGSVDPPK